MKSLKTLISLSQDKLDQKRKVISALDDQKNSSCKELESLQEELNYEQQFISHSNGVSPKSQILSFYDSYYSINLSKQESIKEHVADLDRQIDVLRSELQEIFLEMKKYEKIQESYDAKEMKEQQDRENLEMDEVALNGFNNRD